jgi:hypothetical protein
MHCLSQGLILSLHSMRNFLVTSKTFPTSFSLSDSLELHSKFKFKGNLKEFPLVESLLAQIQIIHLHWGYFCEELFNSSFNSSLPSSLMFIILLDIQLEHLIVRSLI